MARPSVSVGPGRGSGARAASIRAMVARNGRSARRYHRREPTGTTSQLHLTDPRCHDAPKSWMSGGPRCSPIEDAEPMAQTETRPGFRLPWGAERTETDPQADVAPASAPEASDQNPVEELVTPDMIDMKAPATAAARRPTQFMADLSRAMQAAAESSRDETMARLSAEAKTVVEEIHAASTEEGASLRRRADDDVAAVREWSKGEIARIREETEARIATRKTALDGEMEAHAHVVEARVQQVAATVADYEAQMAEFFQRLLAEEDPPRIATMAETMPDPPDLANIAASIAEPQVEPFDPGAARLALIPDAAAPEAGEAAPEGGEAAPDFAAAEAEALAFTGDAEVDGDG